MLAQNPSLSCDIFCRVIDNFGDAGVCWRLAQQLVKEHHCAVRLIIDQWQAWAPLVGMPLDAEPAFPLLFAGVEVHLWQAWAMQQPAPVPANLVIEAFACELPNNTIQALQTSNTPNVWVNLEYLSAEPWVADYHRLCSTHPQNGLRKTFFFPGFTAKTGGLLREANIIQTQQHRRQSPQTSEAFWHSLGYTPPPIQALTVSLFAYGHPHLSRWLSHLCHSPQAIHLYIPAGRMLDAVQTVLNQTLPINTCIQKDALILCALPFLTQPQYDALLAHCMLNGVRGEDSFIRAHWAGRSFFWQIYPQEDNAHLPKLHAFLDRLTEHAPAPLAQVIRNWHAAWNNAPGAPDILEAWDRFIEQYPTLTRHHSAWTEKCAQNSNLAQNLMLFYKQQVQ